MLLREGGPSPGDRAGPSSAEQLRGGSVSQRYPRRPGQVSPDPPPAGAFLVRASGEAEAVATRGTYPPKHACMNVGGCGVWRVLRVAVRDGGVVCSR